MKKFCVVSIFLVSLAAGVRAETSLSLGIGAEANGYSQNGVAAGLAGLMDFRLNEMFSLGIRGVYCLDIGQTNPSNLAVLELTGNVRWYFMRSKKLLSYYYLWQNKYHFFAQIDGGGAFLYTKDSGTKAESSTSFGFSAGARIMFSSFYVEPYVRYSTTSIFGLGVLAGWTIMRRSDE